jgi:hypothetical protein
MLEGDMASRTALPPEAKAGGSATLSVGSNRELLLNMPESRAEILPQGSQSLELLSSPAGPSEAAYNFRKTGYNRGVLTAPTEQAGSPLPELSVETSAFLASARIVGRDEQGKFYILTEELTNADNFDGPTRILRYSREGIFESSAEVPIENYQCTPNRPIAVSPEGRVLFLGVSPGQPVEILEIKIEGGAIPPKRPGDAPGPGIELLQNDVEMMRALEELNGTTNIENLGVKIAPIQRSDVVARAHAAVSLKWTVLSDNLSRQGLSSRCDPPNGYMWEQAGYLKVQVNKPIIGIPYRWGGHHPELAHYTAKQERGFLASDVCTCRSKEYNYCIVPDAIGFDCSGFVSYAWRTQYYTTSSMSAIAYQIAREDLKPGDAINKAGSHIRLVVGVISDERGFFVQTVESAVSCGRVCDATYNIGSLRGYKPIRFKGIQGWGVNSCNLTREGGATQVDCTTWLQRWDQL